MRVCAIIQARMGSTRLPGKIMLPMSSDHALCHNISRIIHSKKVENTIVATSNKIADDIVVRYAKRAGAEVFRGSEKDVLGRMYHAATEADAGIVVRITSDCPLIDPSVVDRVINRLKTTEADYCSNTIERTFPRGLDVEAFTFESFNRVYKEATKQHHREHVTPYYHENTDRFDLESVTSDEVFEEHWMQDRTDLRLTLDEADDYELLKQVYDRVEFDQILPIKEAVKTIDENDLQRLNANVKQKAVTNASDDPN